MKLTRTGIGRYSKISTGADLPNISVGVQQPLLESFIASEGDTQFTLTQFTIKNDYGHMVFLNGQLQRKDDQYTVSSDGTTITFSFSMTGGEKIDVLLLGSYANVWLSRLEDVSNDLASAILNAESKGSASSSNRLAVVNEVIKPISWLNSELGVGEISGIDFNIYFDPAGSTYANGGRGTSSNPFSDLQDFLGLTRSYLATSVDYNLVLDLSLIHI